MVLFNDYSFCILSVILQLFAIVFAIDRWVENRDNWKPRELNVKVLLFLSTSYITVEVVLSYLRDNRFENLSNFLDKL
jgi:hypothetical protein